LSIEFLKTDFEKVSYLQNLLTNRATGLAANDHEYMVLRQQLLSNPSLSSMLPSWLKLHGNLDSFWNYIKSKFGTYAERRTYLSEQFTPLLDVLEFGTSPPPTPQFIRPSSISSISPSQVVPRNKRKVFIVHGRDDLAKLEVSRFIEKLGLDAIILHEQASSGMTIIEKIEHYSNDADFALVLYTECDEGRGVHERPQNPKFRARQNVVFEHGFLISKLGRENVCSLVKGDVETPNDLSGVVHVPMDGPGAWKMGVARELQACGYKINPFY
jgi:hypothetical protein